MTNTYNAPSITSPIPNTTNLAGLAELLLAAVVARKAVMDCLTDCGRYVAVPASEYIQRTREYDEAVIDVRNDLPERHKGAALLLTLHAVKAHRDGTGICTMLVEKGIF